MLYDKLNEYSKSGVYPFHMPGHKRCDILNGGAIPYNLDITEINDFDNLHNPDSVIYNIQEKAKKIYCTDYAFLLVNGATCGILAAIRSMTNYGDSVLLARNCHKSVYNAIELCGLDAKYIIPQTDDEFGIVSSVSPDSVERALKNNTNIKLVIITSPTYEGVASDIRALKNICNKYNAKLFVDESHGAHFPFSDFFPNSSMNEGADAAVVSLHKTLPSLTQTALLLTNDEMLSNKFENNLSIFETSSPSYILMSSSEVCFDYLINNLSVFKVFEDNLIDFYNSCKQLKILKILCTDKIPYEFYGFDKSKIVISTASSNISGIELAEILRNNFKIETEMAYNNYVIAMSSICDTKAAFDMLKDALLSIDSQLKFNKISKVYIQSNHLPQKKFKASDAYNYSSHTVKLSESIGRISLEYIWAYPPGIPIIVPGETISREIVDNIFEWVQIGIKVQSTEKQIPDYITVAEN